MKKFKQNPKLIDKVSETIDIARWGRQDGERLKLGRKAGNKSNDGKRQEIDHTHVTNRERIQGICGGITQEKYGLYAPDEL